MHNRLILPLLCAASVAFVAAPFSHDEKAIASVKRHGEEMTAPIVTTFDITRQHDDTEKLHFSLHVTNNTTKMLELRFPDGQTHDFVVKDFAGKEVWRWSEGRRRSGAAQRDPAREVHRRFPARPRGVERLQTHVHSELRADSAG
jgi:hypothetical protein